MIVKWIVINTLKEVFCSNCCTTRLGYPSNKKGGRVCEGCYGRHLEEVERKRINDAATMIQKMFRAHYIRREYKLQSNNRSLYVV
jgi:hypothetical protein